MFSESTQPTNAPDASRVDGRNLVEAFVNRAKICSEKRVYSVKKNDVYTAIFWRELDLLVRSALSGLKQYGIERGDRIAIYSNCRPEWSAADIAIMAAGGVTVPIYQSSAVGDLEYLLRHCGARLVFVENNALAVKLAEALSRLGTEVPVVSFEPDVPGTIYWGKFTQKRISEKELVRSAAEIQPDDTASIVYTSGTTGQPKGALIAHSCFTSVLRGIVAEVPLYRSDTTLTFLPFAHVLGRIESFLPIYSGITLGFAENFNSISQNLVELRPTLMMAVPRIFEKLHASLIAHIRSQPAWDRQIFAWAKRVGVRVARARADKDDIALATRLKYAVADRLIFSAVRKRLGGKLRLAVSGGAALNKELCEFFHCCGITILEGYGLTETTSAITVNRPNDFKFGTVGKPLPGVELKIESDSEICVKGQAVFKGYFKDGRATEQVLSKDGWFATGDIGTIDRDGFVQITDRKKELIVTSGGKNIAPTKLENLLKEIPYVANALVVGDGRKYLVALLTPNEIALRQWARARGDLEASKDELKNNKALLADIGLEIKKINERLASYETIKRFELLGSDFSIDSGELTPSLKLKRKVCEQIYRDQIESLYK